jgi:hypothetical protein
VYVVWLQGEYEAGNINGTTITAELYESELETLGAYFASAIPELTQMLVIEIGGQGTGGGAIMAMATSSLNHAAIRNAQIEACEDSANLTLVYPGAYSFLSRGYHSDGSHFNQTGLNIIGTAGARNLADPTPLAAVSAPLAVTNYVDTVTTARASRTISHTTAVGTKCIIVPTGLTRLNSGSSFNLTITYNGVTLFRTAFATGTSNAPSCRGNAAVHYINESDFGGSLSGVTYNLVVTPASNCNTFEVAVLDMPEELLPDTEGGQWTTNTTGTVMTGDVSTNGPALIVTMGCTTSDGAAALTATLSGSTEYFDHGLNMSGTRSGQAVFGQTVEAARVVAKSISATWTATCTSLALCLVAFRRKMSGE